MIVAGAWWVLCQTAAILKGLAVVGKVGGLVLWAVRLAVVLVAARRAEKGPA